MIEIGRMAVKDSRPITVLNSKQERFLLDECDQWWFPI